MIPPRSKKVPDTALRISEITHNLQRAVAGYDAPLVTLMQPSASGKAAKQCLAPFCDRLDLLLSADSDITAE